MPRDSGVSVAGNRPPRKTKPKPVRIKNRVPEIPQVLAPKALKRARAEPAKFHAETRKKLSPEERRRSAAETFTRIAKGKSISTTQLRIARTQVEVGRRKRLGVDVNVPIKKQAPEKQLAHALDEPTEKKRMIEQSKVYRRSAIRETIDTKWRKRFDEDPDLRRALSLADQGKEGAALKRLPEDLKPQVNAYRERQFRKGTPAGKLGIEAPDVVARGARTAVQSGVSVAKALASDPVGQTGNLVKDAATTTAMLPLALGKAAAAVSSAATAKTIGVGSTKPLNTLGKQIAEDYERRYGEVWRNEPGAVKRQVKRLKEEGVFPEALDAAGLFGPATGAAVGGTARVGSRLHAAARPGTRAGALERRVVRGRPMRRQAGSGLVKAQRSAKFRIGRIAKESVIDATRRAVEKRKVAQLQVLKAKPVRARTPAETKRFQKLSAQVRTKAILDVPAVRSLSSMGPLPTRKLSALRGQVRPAAKVLVRSMHLADFKNKRLVTESLGPDIAALKTPQQRQAAWIAAGTGIRSTTPAPEATALLEDWSSRLGKKSDLRAVTEAAAADPAAWFTPHIDGVADRELARAGKLGPEDARAAEAALVKQQALGLGDFDPSAESPSEFIDRVNVAGGPGLKPGARVGIHRTAAPPIEARANLTPTFTAPRLGKKEQKALRQGNVLADLAVNVKTHERELAYKAGQSLAHDIAANYAVRELPGFTKPIPESGLTKAALTKRVFDAGLEATDDPAHWKHWGVIKAPGPGDRYTLVHHDLASAIRMMQNPPGSRERLVSGVLTRWSSALLLGTSPVWLGYQVLANLGQVLIGEPRALAHGLRNIKLLKGLSKSERDLIDVVGGSGPQHHSLWDGERLSTQMTGQVSKMTRLYAGMRHLGGGLFRLDHKQNIGWRRLATAEALRTRLRMEHELGGAGGVFDELAAIKSALAAFDTPTSELLTSEAAATSYARVVRAVDYAGERTLRVLGDWTTFTPRERQFLKNTTLFYGYLRFSLRLLFHTLPTDHPLMTSVAAQLGRLEYGELEELLGKDGILPYMIGRWYVDEATKAVAVNRMNPLSNALTEAGLDPSSPAGLGRLAPILSTPLVQAIIEGMSGRDSITGQAFKVVDPLTGRLVELERPTWGTAVQSFANNIGNLSVIYRTAREAQYRGEDETFQKRSDLSLPFAQQYGTLSPEKQVYEEEKAAASRQTTGQKIAGATIPLFPQSTNIPLVAAEASRAKALQHGDEVGARLEHLAPGAERERRRALRRARRERRRRQMFGEALSGPESRELRRDERRLARREAMFGE